MASKSNRSFSDSPSDMYVDRHIANPSSFSNIFSDRVYGFSVRWAISDPSIIEFVACEYDF